MKLMKKAMYSAALVQVILPILYFALGALPESETWATIKVSALAPFLLGAFLLPKYQLLNVSPELQFWLRPAITLIFNFVVYFLLFYACLRLWQRRNKGNHFEAPIAMNPAQ